MNEPLYPAARIFAAKIADQFVSRADECIAKSRKDGPLPDPGAVEALVDAAFWASLQREEGYAPEISLAFLPPERAVRPLLFASPLPLSPAGARAPGTRGRAARHPPRRLARRATACSCGARRA